MRRVTVQDISTCLRETLKRPEITNDIAQLIYFKDQVNTNVVVEDDMSEEEFLGTFLPLALFHFTTVAFDRVCPVVRDGEGQGDGRKIQLA